MLLMERLNDARMLETEITGLMLSVLTEYKTLGRVQPGMLDALHDKVEAFADILSEEI